MPIPLLDCVPFHQEEGNSLMFADLHQLVLVGLCQRPGTDRVEEWTSQVVLSMSKDSTNKLVHAVGN